MTTIQPSSVSAINDAHARCLALDTDIRASLLAKVNAIRSVGLMLTSLKSGTKTGHWASLFANDTPAEARFRFGDRTARQYMRFAASLPQEVTSLPDGIASLTAFMRHTDALPVRDTKQQQASGANPFSALMRSVQTISITCKAWGDVGSWDTQRREQAKEQLRPIVELYERL